MSEVAKLEMGGGSVEEMLDRPVDRSSQRGRSCQAPQPLRFGFWSAWNRFGVPVTCLYARRTECFLLCAPQNLAPNNPQTERG